MKQEDRHNNLLQILNEYNKSGIIPMHMPGHKRNAKMLNNDLPWKLDITEVGDFDNLHNPTGILKDSMNRAAKLWGSRHAYYLVNGSTAGILSGIHACTNYGDKILIARNCHKSVYHAIEICGLNPIYIEPAVIESYDIYGSILPKDIKNTLNKHPDIKLAVITSPTYEGIISDISSIANILHKKNIPLLIDEAHGAHLGFFSGLPKGAVDLGADIVIHSLHKTLPSLTQTGVMHIQGDLVCEKKIQHALSVFQTSSPSYVLMASIDNCIDLLEKHGEELFEKWSNQLKIFSESTSKLKHLRVFGSEKNHADNSSVYAYDPAKILISCNNTNYSGTAIQNKLLSEFNIQLEMAYLNNALAITSICDDDESLIRFAKALIEIDKECIKKNIEKSNLSFPPLIQMQKIQINSAIKAKHEVVSFKDSVGRVSGEYLWVFPPGVPLLVPGQIITKEEIQTITELSQDAEIISTFNLMPQEIHVIDE